jgi:hypothetical protein
MNRTLAAALVVVGFVVGAAFGVVAERVSTGDAGADTPAATLWTPAAPPLVVTPETPVVARPDSQVERVTPDDTACGAGGRTIISYAFAVSPTSMDPQYGDICVAPESACARVVTLHGALPEPCWRVAQGQ